MGREANTEPKYDLLALVTLDKSRILGGKQLTLLAKDEEEQKTMTADIAKALKADVVKMNSGDYLVIRV
ncbi:capping complex subunit for YIEGIA [Neobacillus dielmonensis]|uniref:capping complex subunit for YIEGIA n=1 Tax=Neobacillus dielmonensis TaxID=1347369 RepID=UPI0005A8356E|nr:hypothetical protein [Neobacillus dielmonensis]